MSHTTSLLRSLPIAMLFGVATAQSPATPQAGPSAFPAAVDSIVASRMSRMQVPGIVVGIARGDSLWVRPYGTADVENAIPMTADASFRIASLTKPMTAVAIMQLAERRALSLDDEIQRHVPIYPRKQWPVTIRALLGHLAGVTDYQGEAEERLTRGYTTDEAIRIFADRPLAIEPGTDFFYSNYGYGLLGAAIEHRSGVRYDAYMRAHVWAPLGMTATHLDRPETVVPHRVRGYALEGTRLRNSDFVNITSRSSAGGVRGTVGDLLRFSRALYDRRLLSRASYETMWTSGRTHGGGTTSYGFGFELMPGGGAFVIGHTGAQQETSTAMVIVPERRIAVVVAANLERFDARGLAMRILESLTDIRMSAPLYGTRLGDRDPALQGIQAAFALGRARYERDGHVAPPADARLRAAFTRWNAGDHRDAEAVGAFMASRLGATPTPDAFHFFAAYSRLDLTANHIPAWARLTPEVAAALFRAWNGWEALASLPVSDRLLDAPLVRVTLRDFERAIEGRDLYPDWSDGMQEAMRYHSLRGDDEVALEIGEALARWYPRLGNPSSAQGAQAVARIAAGRHAEGMELLRRAHARNAAGQSSVRRMVATAREYEQSGRPDAALRLLVATRELHPASPGAAFAHAELLASTGDTTGAIEAYETALRLDPSFANATRAADALRRLRGR